MSIPAWKQAVLERKRRHKLGNLDAEQVGLSELPSWKRDLLLKKRNLFLDDDGYVKQIGNTDSPVYESDDDGSAYTSPNRPHLGSTYNQQTTSLELGNTTKTKSNNIVCGTDEDDTVTAGVDEHVLPFSMNPWIKNERGGTKHRIGLGACNNISRPNSLVGMKVDSDQRGRSDEAIVKGTPSDLPEADQEYEMVYRQGFVSKLRNRFSSMSDLLDLDDNQSPDQASYFNHGLARRSSSLASLEDVDKRESEGAAMEKSMSFDAGNFAVCDSAVLSREDVVIIENKKPEMQTSAESASRDKPEVKTSPQYREMIPEELPKPNTVAMFRSLFENANIKDSNSTTSVTLRKIVVDEMESKRNSCNDESLLSLGQIEEVTPQSSPIHRCRKPATSSEQKGNNNVRLKNSETRTHKKNVVDSPSYTGRMSTSPMSPVHKQESTSSEGAHQSLEEHNCKQQQRKPDKIMVLEKKITEVHSHYVPVRAIVTQSHIDEAATEPSVLEEELVKPSKIVGQSKRRVKTAGFSETFLSKPIQNAPRQLQNQEEEWVAVGEVQYTRANKAPEVTAEVPFKLNRPNRQPNGSDVFANGVNSVTSSTATEMQSRSSEDVDRVMSGEKERKINHIELLYSQCHDEDTQGSVENEQVFSKQQSSSAIMESDILEVETADEVLNCYHEFDDDTCAVTSTQACEISAELTTSVVNSQSDSRHVLVVEAALTAIVSEAPSDPLADRHDDDSIRHHSPLPVTNIDEVASSDSNESDEDEPTEYNVTLPPDEAPGQDPLSSYIIHSYYESPPPPRLPSNVPPSAEHGDDVPVSKIDELANGGGELNTDSGIYLIQSSFGHVIYTTLNETEEDDEEDEGMDEYELFDPVFEGSHVIIDGKSSLIQRRNKNLRIKFCNKTPSPFEYPSEQSLLEDDHPHDNGCQEMMNGDVSQNDKPTFELTMKNSPVITTSGLASYLPTKLHQDYELGKEQPKTANNIIISLPKRVKEEEKQNEETWAKPVEEQITWSDSASSDLLF
ncbi:PREDICTED: uncharacterized protein LOC106807483 [Priapulus caudatus]|uniref:Uncharacterized protein LOC106807483 n=1 Tax=Priapulus caudatus TaxID=37621 RepID=A0ABM1DZD0_PRICU|nr:PREDICTED: uncharacterized protein LOC106807483 [Priapulus caudatus]